MKKSSIIRTFITYILLLAIAVYAISMMNSEVAKNMSYTEFLQKIEEKSVEKIVIDNSKQMADVKIKNEEKFENEDIEILQDMILIAVNDATKKINEEINKKMGNQVGALSSFL